MVPIHYKVWARDYSVMYGSAGLSVLYYLSCLRDQRHVYYYLFGAL